MQAKSNTNNFKTQVSKYLEILEQIFDATRFPVERQHGIRCAIRLQLDSKTHLDDWFQVNDYYFGLKLLGREADSKSEDAIRQAGKRERDAQIRTAAQIGYTFVQFSPGGRERNNPNPIPGKMKLPVMDMMQAVEDESFEFYKTARRWDRAINSAIQANLYRIRDKVARIDKFERATPFIPAGNRSVELEAKRLFKKALTKGVNPFEVLNRVVESPEGYAMAQSIAYANETVMGNKNDASKVTTTQQPVNADNAGIYGNPNGASQFPVNLLNNEVSKNVMTAVFDQKPQLNLSHNEQFSSLQIFFDGELCLELPSVTADKADLICREAKNLVTAPKIGFITNSPGAQQTSNYDPSIYSGQNTGGGATFANPPLNSPDCAADNFEHDEVVIFVDPYEACDEQSYMVTDYTDIKRPSSKALPMSESIANEGPRRRAAALGDGPHENNHAAEVVEPHCPDCQKYEFGDVDVLRVWVSNWFPKLNQSNFDSIVHQIENHKGRKEGKLITVSEFLFFKKTAQSTRKDPNRHGTKSD